MTIIDITVLVVIGSSALIGIFRGLIKEALSLVTWVTAIFIAAMFSSQLSNVMSGMINNPSVRVFAAFALLFIATIFVGSLISNLLSKFISKVGLGGVDRVLGGMFGILRGLVILIIFIIFTLPLDFTQGWFQNSLFVPYIIELIEYIKEILGIVTI